MRQIYQIAESNRIEKNRFGSENRIESKLFLPELEWSSVCIVVGEAAGGGGSSVRTPAGAVTSRRHA